MDINSIVEIANGLNGVVQDVKANKITIPELKELMSEIKFQVIRGIEMIPLIVKGENLEEYGISEIQRAAILEEMKQEEEKFNYKKTKHNIIMVLNILSLVDKDLGEAIILPVFNEIFKAVIPALEETHSDSAKAIKKSMKKFKKLQDKN